MRLTNGETMRIIPFLATSLFVSLLTLPLSSHALELPPVESFHNGLGLQGYTGIFNTPNAHVTDEGWFYALYSNQKEINWRERVPFEDNYLFSAGLFNFLEVGGRFFEAPGAGRDLSANFKVTSAPLTRNYPLLPVIAGGMQDLGGGATMLQTKYIVASEDIWRFRLSAGYGSGPDRMKGVFAGGEFKAHDWVYLLGEYDTKETNVGARVVLPQFWKIPISFTASAKTSLDYKPGNFDIAVGLSVPLDFKIRKQKSADSGQGAMAREPETASAPVKTVSGVGTANQPAASEVAVNKATTPVSETSVAVSPIAKGETGKLDLNRLRDQLIQQGFLNVRVGTREKTLVVEYENARYNHNELDALGLVAGIATAADGQSHYDRLEIVIRRRNIAMMQVSAPFSSLRSFFLEHGNTSDLNAMMDISLGVDTNGVRYQEGDRNSSFLKSSLVLAPGLTTWVGTEVGVFDYVLSLKPELTVQAWKGAALNARWDIPVSWSDNLEDGKTFRNSRNDPQLDRLMFFQGFKPLPDVMVNLGAGMYVHHVNGTINEITWTPGDGSSRIHLSQGWTEHSITHQKNEIYLAAYRYYFSPLDLSLEGTYGRFWAQDHGFSLELKRFFDDTAVSVYYKNSKATDSKKWEAVGIQFSFPLTPRQDMKPYAVQVRGSDEWSYAQETTLKNNNFDNKRGPLNYLAPYPLTLTPKPTSGLLQAYQNRDRLNAAYIRAHLERLREAWMKFKD